MPNDTVTGGAAAPVPQFPMSKEAIDKAVREGRNIAPLPADDFEKPKRPPSLSPGRMRPGAAAYNTWFVEVEEGTSREAVLHPSFWAHVAARLRRLDHIEVVDEQASFKTVLIVRSADKNQAVVGELSHVEIKSAVAAEVIAEGYEVKYRGAKYKHSVVDVKGNVVKDGFGTKQEAEAWIATRAAAMAG